MHRHTAVASIIAATWALSACGVTSPDAGAARASQDAPRLLVDLQSLPDGHPPLPGLSSPPALPEGHPPVPGFHSPPALPEGHPRCPARGPLETPPSDAGMEQALQSPPELIST
jgi:predicted small lipoprotein YifL